MDHRDIAFGITVRFYPDALKAYNELNESWHLALPDDPHDWDGYELTRAIDAEIVVINDIDSSMDV